MLLLAIGGWQFGEAIWIHAKAILAQVLIKHAWAQTTDGAARVRPWGWADTWPVARLSVPRLGIDQIVLAGASGRTLAFGPAHLGYSPDPGAAGNAVISGHRDTHFKFLGELAAGDEIVVTADHGFAAAYEITAGQQQQNDDRHRAHGFPPVLVRASTISASMSAPRAEPVPPIPQPKLLIASTTSARRAAYGSHGR